MKFVATLEGSLAFAICPAPKKNEPSSEQSTGDLVSTAADVFPAARWRAGLVVYRLGAKSGAGSRSNRCAMWIHDYERAHPR